MTSQAVDAIEAAANQTEFEDACLVTMKPGLSSPTLFIFPGFGGRVERLNELAVRLETTQRVIGLRSRGSDGMSCADSRVDTMADHYVSSILTVQDSGPYLLLGHSFGGLIAIEIARRLLQTGRHVACLMMLDTNYGERFWPLPYYIRNLQNRIRRRANEFRTTPPSQRGAYLADSFARLKRRWGGVALPEVIKYDAMASHEFAFDQYGPEFYPGKVIFFRAALQDYPADPNVLWRGRVNQLEVHSTQGGHLTMLDRPNVIPLASAISLQLAEALNRPK